MKRKINLLAIAFLLVFSCIVFVSCTQKTTKINYIENRVTNEITQKITTYPNELDIKQVEDLVKTCVDKVSPSVVGVTLKKIVNAKVNGVDTLFEDIESMGSGVIYKRVENKDDKGIITSYTYYAYTNAHVVTSSEKGENVIYVYIDSEKLEIKAKVLGLDEKIDLACISFDSYLYFEPVEKGDSSKLSIGSMVIAVGNPDGYNYFGSATYGIISNLNRFLSFDTDNDGVTDYVGEYLQTDAAINPGNSGGGLFTLDGKLVGINSIKLASEKIDNMGFAIPISVVQYVVENYLEKNREILRPRLGVTCIAVKDINSSFMIEHNLTSLPDIYGGFTPYGIYVESLSKNGSIVGVGIEVGDIILSFDGHKLYSSNDLSGRLNSLDKYKLGDEVKIRYYSSRNDEVKEVTVILKTGD